MKTLLILTMLIGSSAFADGFVCYSSDRSLKVKMLNHVEPAEGTRTGSVMIVSDQTISDGKKTTVVFDSEEDTLTTDGTFWRGQVPEGVKGGRNIVGTKLNQISTFDVQVAYNYNRPVKSGAELSGELIVTKVNGNKLHEDLTCYRYLKN